MQWLCHYWASNIQSRETRVSLLPMLFLELSSIDAEGEDSLFEESSEKDDKFNNFVRSLNQTTLQCLDLYDNYLVHVIPVTQFTSSRLWFTLVAQGSSWQLWPLATTCLL